ncbi:MULTISPECIES: hypothetical protein [unclassified Shewanella]|uniref:hypothetical protein n=1 Tax=unclassified Shewanella TaxID=196818 RepID=UPI00354F200A
MQKIIFICHYFPPETNVGVRRVLFWANYYTNLGLDVTIITPKRNIDNGNLSVVDSKVKVVHFDFLSANDVLFENEIDEDNVDTQEFNSNFIRTLMVRFKRKVVNPIFGQLLDNRLPNILFNCISVFFDRYKFVFSDVAINKSTVIISTAPPWPSHLLSVVLSKKYKIPLYLDYRDPFSSNHMFSSLFSKIETGIDRWLCSNASGVITVSHVWKDYYSRFNSNVFLARNGFDVEMFRLDTVYDANSVLNMNSNVISLNYFGTVEHKERFPLVLLELIRVKNLSVEINFFGSCSLVLEYVNKYPELKSKVFLRGDLHYSDAISLMKKSMINLVVESTDSENIIANGLVPTKIYEYMASLRPIIAIGSKNSEFIELLNKSGLLLNHDSSVESLLRVLDVNYLTTLNVKPNVEYIKKMSRQLVALDVLDFLRS